MSKLVGGRIATVLTCGMAFAPGVAAAETSADKAALQQATASCKVEVKEYAQYHDTLWWQRHKMVQKCVKYVVVKK